MKELLCIFLLFATSARFAFGVTVTVTSANDAGPGSLRQAIADAASGDTIIFDLAVPSQISLTSGELLIDKDLIITGPGATSLTISASPSASSRIFEVISGANVTISGVT